MEKKNDRASPRMNSKGRWPFKPGNPPCRKRKGKYSISAAEKATNVGARTTKTTFRERAFRKKKEGVLTPTRQKKNVNRRKKPLNLSVRQPTEGHTKKRLLVQHDNSNNREEFLGGKTSRGPWHIRVSGVQHWLPFTPKRTGNQKERDRKEKEAGWVLTYWVRA